MYFQEKIQFSYFPKYEIWTKYTFINIIQFGEAKFDYLTIMSIGFMSYTFIGFCSTKWIQ